MVQEAYETLCNRERRSADDKNRTDAGQTFSTDNPRESASSYAQGPPPSHNTGYKNARQRRKEREQWQRFNRGRQEREERKASRMRSLRGSAG